MTSFSKKIFCRIGIAVAVFFISALPYWIWNIVGGGLAWPDFLRVPVAPNAVFDSYLYFQQMSLLQAGIVTGSFGWFTQPIVWLMRMFPQASIPEIWILSRWLTLLLFCWAGPWCIRRFSGVSKNISRWLMLCFWFSFLLVISLRPGVFSWYLPFGFLGLGLLSFLGDALKQKRWMRALLISAASLAILKIYPWFFLLGFTFIVTQVAVVFLAKYRLWLGALFIAGVASICIGGVLIATQTISVPIPDSLAFYERNGIGFAHVPLVSNTTLASVLWLWALTRLHRVRRDAPVELTGWMWIVMLVLWLSPPLVGLDLLNDHFIIVAAMLSWMSLALFVREPAESDVSTKPFRDRVLFGIAIVASLFFLYVLQQALRNVGQFAVYTIHLSLWLALAVAASSLAWRRIRWPLLVLCVLLGTIGLVSTLNRNKNEMPGLLSRLPTITWIQEHVPTGEAICADPVNAKIFAAHAGRLTYPSESNLMFPESDDVLQRRLVTIGGAYDTFAAQDQDSFSFLINGVRDVACDQFAKLAAILRTLGTSDASVNRFIGCRREKALAFERDVLDAVRATPLNADAFRELCPWVIIPDDRKPYWSLPERYEEIRVQEGVSVWHVLGS